MPLHDEISIGPNQSLDPLILDQALQELAQVNARLARVVTCRYFGDMVSLGTNAAVADVLGVKLTGYLAWLIWRTYYLGRLQGVESKSRVATDWFLDTFLERYTAQLELE